MFQLSLDGNISDASYSAPDGFKLLGSHIEDGRTVVAIGTDKEGGDTIPSGEPFVTVAAPDTPCVKYGVNDTTMLLAAEEGVEAVSMESGKRVTFVQPVFYLNYLKFFRASMVFWSSSGLGTSFFPVMARAKFSAMISSGLVV